MNKNLVSTAAMAAAAVISMDASAIAVTTSSDGSLLANTILGAGITASNITYTGAAAASGTFTGGLAAGIGMESGIILTSGNAELAEGPNDSSGAGSSNGAPGDAQLTALAGGSTFNAAVLEFDFTTAGGDLFFNYVFASEEYNEFLEFNDVFAFFLNGTNIALVPGTSTPVSVGNVNCGPTGTGTGPNCAFFNNNPPGSLNLQYDGFTDVFTATALGLAPGTHHIKLAIADASDSVLDSAVFIQAGTFSDQPTNGLPEPGSLALMGGVMMAFALGQRRRPPKAR